MKKRKIISIVLNICLLFNITFVYNVQATTMPKNKSIYIDARSAIAIDSKTKCVLYEKNAEMLLPIASTTKIMTTLVALKYGNLDDKFEVSTKAASIRGSQVGYKKGESVSLKELLYGLMLRSGNDAAITIAEGLSGSVEKFCELMNEYAVEIGALNSHFESPHGLDSQNHYSTAYDLARITAKAKENELFNKIVGVKDVEAKEYGFTRSYHNINKILYQIPNANGVKTGYTGGAGKCLVTSIKDDDDDIIIVVLNCTPRWKETGKIYKFVKENYDFKKITSKNQVIDNIVYKDNKKINLISHKDIVVPVGKQEHCEFKVVKPKNIPSNVYKGMDLGKIDVYKDNKLVASETLKSQNDASTKKIKGFIENIKGLFSRKH
ncbi:D-alanyl-D-alanine carboxypeptidase [Clostridium botulinum]|uniref:serine-type D-Ala-D-Ala carboxypeptidase n=1 Tax=Clostridium botulinum C/D str. DC5 TaxID=1443128 RepID=A0A0A0IKE8_CLOBO|nr:D-alanyl-D-alanine carboxypeptidase family protein [Clostridium botulinum]KEI07074.1 D-alanyl-D-alanine carboxypeptidase [Clostridium botulinum C/D str. BKT75002]KEI12151.1 D-alanyl-D-alanine carboxypeptidase [Clostridium botulinum C/D str. BKT2873]KGM96836.1 D-alanyl-D-alanine carboxypeptidase [Clostridium botulinum D str. CCUG 7971]KGN01950.1 D-alanyl-D-alanine carboxypeptidase [Clostridium botulinum C/D str. DC5]KOC48587.1 D-alanyl-D-alanine carboxypeptidase [Clostridium botulinum]